MKNATPAQLGALNGILQKMGLMDQKQALVKQYSNDRATSSKDLYIDEARQLIGDLLKDKKKEEEPDGKDTGPMIRKLFSMAHEMGWIEKKNVVGKDGEIIEVKDSRHLYNWVEKYGYLKKELRKYTYDELPKLVSTFEQNVYNRYIDTRFKKR